MPWVGPAITADALANTIASFHATHRRLYTFDQKDAVVELTGLRVEATGRLSKPAVLEVPPGGPAEAARTGSQRVWFDDEWRLATVYDRDRLGAGAVLRGPAIVEQMAATLRVKPEEVREMETRLSGHDIALESHGEDEDEAAYSPIAYLSDPDIEPSRILEIEEHERNKTAGLQTALQSLDPRSRRIIEARWLREKDAATLHDLADEFKVSAERIRQIEVKALQKMKGAMVPA